MNKVHWQREIILKKKKNFLIVFVNAFFLQSLGYGFDDLVGKKK